MITISGGKARSRRTVFEAEQSLEQLMKDLAPDERKAAKVLMRQLGHGQTELYDLLNEVQYDREQVSMRQFLEDDYYLGLSTKTLYPKLKEDLIEFDATGPYSEVLLGGSIGYGKTTLASILMAWTLYKMSCLRDPQSTFGMSQGSEIHFILLSKNLHLARRVLLSAVMEKIKLSPYFNSDFPFTAGRDEVKFPKGLVLQIGSVNSERVLGLNVFACASDEVNYMTGSGNRQAIKTAVGQKATEANYDQAESMYAKIDRRIKSRFLKGGMVPAVNILLSSKTTKNSFLERRIAQARVDPNVFVVEYSNWEIRKDKFSNGSFRVLVGSMTARSRILGVDEKIPDGLLQETGSLIIDVPNEYRVDFERDLNNAIRDIAGVGTDAISSFITRQEKVFSAIKPELFHPFSVDEWTFGTDGEFQWGRICDTFTRKLKGGYEEIGWRPKRNPNAARHVHIDVAISGDSLGLAMGHNTRTVEVVRRSPEGEQYADLADEVEIDLMMRINPPPGEYIFLPDIRRLVYELMEHGFQISGFSCDSYGSTEMIQQMSARGVTSEIISVDRTNEAYEKLKAAMYEDRLRMYGYKPFIDEILGLEYDRVRGKVDHPVHASKDVADAVAGVCEGLSRRAANAPLGFSVGTNPRHQDDPDQDGAWVLSGRSRPVTGREVIEPAKLPSGKKSGSGGGLPPLPFLGG